MFGDYLLPADPYSENDFSVRCLEYLECDEDWRSKQIAFWNKYLKGISPKDFYDVMTCGLPEGTQIRLEIDSYDQGRLRICVTYESWDTFHDIRIIDFQGQKILSGRMLIDSKCRGRGWGRQLLANYIRIGRLCGLSYMYARPSLNNGGYTWAKAGFYLRKPFMQNTLKPIIKARLNALERFIPEEHYERALQLSELKQPESIADIAALDFDIFEIPGMKSTLESNTYDEKLRSIFQNIHPIEFALIRDAAQYCHDKNIPFTLGRCLLAGVEWRGFIDFNNEEQLRRIGQYTQCNFG